MSLYTESQQFPYPASNREISNGALASEQLARRVDRKLTYLDSTWLAESKKNTGILTLATNVTGIPTSDSVLLMDTTEQVTPNAWMQSQVPWPLSATGWYHITMTTELAAEGVVTAGSRRRMWVNISTSDTVGADKIVEQWHAEDFQVATGAVNLHHNFVTKFDGKRKFTVWLSHNNASTLRMNAGACRWAAYRIAGL